MAGYVAAATEWWLIWALSLVVFAILMFWNEWW